MALLTLSFTDYIVILIFLVALLYGVCIAGACSYFEEKSKLLNITRALCVFMPIINVVLSIIWLCIFLKKKYRGFSFKEILKNLFEF